MKNIIPLRPYCLLWSGLMLTAIGASFECEAQEGRIACFEPTTSTVWEIGQPATIRWNSIGPVTNIAITIADVRYAEDTGGEVLLTTLRNNAGPYQMQVQSYTFTPDFATLVKGTNVLSGGVLGGQNYIVRFYDLDQCTNAVLIGDSYQFTLTGNLGFNLVLNNQDGGIEHWKRNSTQNVLISSEHLVGSTADFELVNITTGADVVISNIPITRNGEKASIEIPSWLPTGKYNPRIYSEELPLISYEGTSVIEVK